MPYAVVNHLRMHDEVAGPGDPVLLIAGLAAPGVNWALPVETQVRARARRIRRARVGVLPGAHALHIEAAEAFSRAVVRFLTSARSQ